MSPENFNLTVQVVCALFAAGTMVYIFMPSSDALRGEDKTRLAYLYERKDVVYENLRDLNFEYGAGKFPAADYEAMKKSLEDEAASLLAEIERLEQAPATPAATRKRTF